MNWVAKCCKRSFILYKTFAVPCMNNHYMSFLHYLPVLSFEGLLETGNIKPASYLGTPIWCLDTFSTLDSPNTLGEQQWPMYMDMHAVVFVTSPALCGIFQAVFVLFALCYVFFCIRFHLYPFGWFHWQWDNRTITQCQWSVGEEYQTIDHLNPLGTENTTTTLPNI